MSIMYQARCLEVGPVQPLVDLRMAMANLRTKILHFRGFDSSIIYMPRGGIPRPIGNLPESLSQAIVVGVILAGRLGVSVKFAMVSAYTMRVQTLRCC